MNNSILHLSRGSRRKTLCVPVLAAGLLLAISRSASAADTTLPAITVASPTVNQSIAPAAWVDGIVNGNATDDTGVTGVSIKLFHNVGGVRYFWDGGAYVTASTALAGVLGSPGAPSTTWSLSGADFPTAAELGTGAFSVVVSASDAAGNISVAATRNFLVTSDSVSPVVTISNPANNAVFSPASFASSSANGIATDDTAVNTISLKLFRTDGSTKYFWDGGSFVTASVTAPINTTGLGTTSATWSLANVPAAGNVAAGSYTLQVTAKDNSNNASVGTVFFRVATDSAPPTVIISTPASNGHLLASSFTVDTITGRATDDIGATSVSVKLYHTVGGVKYYWNGSAFTTANVSVAAVLSGSVAVDQDWKLATAPNSSDLSPGTYSIQAGAKDASGKSSAFVTRNFVIDPEPASSLRSPSGGSF